MLKRLFFICLLSLVGSLQTADAQATYPSVFTCLTPAQINDVQTRTASIDLTATLQSCLTSTMGASTTVFWPTGSYLIKGTLTPPAGQNELGTAVTWNNGTTIVIGSGTNAPAFKFTSGGAITGFSFIGSATASTPNQHCIYINNTNAVTIERSFLTGCYSLVYMDGVSFYVNLVQNVFYDAFAYQLWINGSTASNSGGVDLIARGNRFVSFNTAHSTAGAVSAVRLSGLGSIIWTDNQITVEYPNGPLFWLDTPAPLFGGALFVNSVFESSGASGQADIYIAGTYAQPWYNLYFANCQVVGSNGPGVQVAYSVATRFTSGSLSSGSSNALLFPTYAVVKDFVVDGVDFEGNGSLSPINAGQASVSISLFSPNWRGSPPIVDFSAMTASAISHFELFGGDLGTATNPVLLPSGTNYTIIAGGKSSISGLNVLGSTSSSCTVTGSVSVMINGTMHNVPYC